MARFKVFPRYRRPSLKTALGITRAKRRIKTASGYYAATRWTRAPTNFKRRMLRRADVSPDVSFRKLERLHWLLLIAALVTIFGAAAGSHGLFQ